jgi:hypothetical protein
VGNIKSKNEWLHTLNWDLVVFDEYHFGAWRETAKELFEGEDEPVAKKEAKLEYAVALEGVNEDLGVLSEKETEFLPITTKAYLYLSGTPFKALATGEFIEEQIFNWTYTDEQRAREDFAAKNHGKWNPYGALPQMRLPMSQMEIQPCEAQAGPTAMSPTPPQQNSLQSQPVSPAMRGRMHLRCLTSCLHSNRLAACLRHAKWRSYWENRHSPFTGWPRDAKSRRW